MYYTFDYKSKKRGKKSIKSRMYLVNPKDQERYFLRLLLLLLKDATSFEDLSTINEITYETFFEAAKIIQLVREDNKWGT